MEEEGLSNNSLDFDFLFNDDLIFTKLDKLDDDWNEYDTLFNLNKDISSKTLGCAESFSPGKELTSKLDSFTENEVLEAITVSDIDSEGVSQENVIGVAKNYSERNDETSMIDVSLYNNYTRDSSSQQQEVEGEVHENHKRRQCLSKVSPPPVLKRQVTHESMSVVARKKSRDWKGKFVKAEPIKWLTITEAIDRNRLLYFSDDQPK